MCSSQLGAGKSAEWNQSRIARNKIVFLKMSSSYALTFACGEETADLPAQTRSVRRPTSGPAPPPPRHGWQGAKPPPALLRQDIAAREAAPDFSDDEDYLRGEALVKRHGDEKKRQREDAQRCICDNAVRADCPLHGDDAESDTDDEEEEEWSAVMPAPLPPPATRPTAAVASSSSSSSSVAAGSGPPSNVSELMESAVREAFKQGIEQGKRMQLPMHCKTCAVRKERNRVAAKESRTKKRREAESVTRGIMLARAAEHVAAVARVAPVAPPPPPPPPSAELDEESLVPPPF